MTTTQKEELPDLPKMAKATTLPELKQAFMAHREKTQGHIERLEQVSEIIGKRPQPSAAKQSMVLLRRGMKRSKISAEAPRSTLAWSRPDRPSSITKWCATERSSRGQISLEYHRLRPYCRAGGHCLVRRFVDDGRQRFTGSLMTAKTASLSSGLARRSSSRPPSPSLSVSPRTFAWLGSR